MGINGLLRNTKSVGEKKHLSSYRHKRVAIDGYSWIHKAVYKCSLDIVLDHNIEGIVSYFLNKMNYMKKLHIKIVLVFDGNELPLKRQTNQERKTNREKYRKLGE